MGFTAAVSHVLSNYAGFSGRARRSEYWWFSLFGFLVGLVAAVLDGALSLGFLYPLAVLALLLPSLAVGVRRLHDTGRSGWWMLLGLVPLVGAIVLLVFFVQDSDAGTNAHGPSPKELQGAHDTGGHPTTV